MCRSYVLVVVAGVLCCSFSEQFCLAKITPAERNEIVYLHNFLRASVTPSASDMEKMVWNEELALLAEAFAAKCAAMPGANQNSSFDSIGRNYFLLSNTDQVDYSVAITSWFNEWSHYDSSYACFRSSCANYTQMVSAHSNQLGCGTFNCERPVSNIGHTGKFFVCNYAPGLILEESPYDKGVPCTRCPIGTSCEPNSNLCSLQVSECPQFRLTLPSGHMLCYNIQGQQDVVYNLISSQYFEVNAGFLTDDLNSSVSWIDSIGIVVFIKGQNNTLIKFSAGDWQVSIEDSVALDASSIEKITVSGGKLIVLPRYPKEIEDSSPSVQIHFDDLQLNFSVHYTKVVLDAHTNFRLSLFWESTGAIPSGAHGIAGQLLQDGVTIDEEEKKLIIPNHDPISVTEIPAWKLPRQADLERSDHRCWSTPLRIIQGGDVIKGTSLVNDVFSTAYKFRGL